MSELKVYHCNEWHNEYTEFYIKFEADKVIADLEESHKMEVEQLLMEIVKLKDKAGQYKILYKEKCRDINTQERFFAEKMAHDKHKRCLAMVEMLEHICPITIRKAKWKGKWHMRWLELAEKFKPNSTAQ